MGTGGLFLRKLRAKVADEPTGFVWVEKDRLAGSGYPASRAQVEWLVKSGIRSILTLTRDPLPAEFTDGLDVAYGHVAMEDHEPPDLESLDKAVDFVARQLGAGRPVLVHCLAGEGRTGCVLAAYVVKAKSEGAAEAMAEIRETKPQFVERTQEKAVFDYASSRPRAG